MTLDSVFEIAFANSAGKIKAVSGKVVALPFTSDVSSVGAVGNVTDRNGDDLDDTITFLFGDLLNVPDGISRGAGDTVTVELVALIVDDTSNYNLRTVTTNANFHYSNSLLSFTSSARLAVRVVVPLLAMEKSCSPPNYPVAGKTVQYTLHLFHTELSYGAAYNVSITDELSELHSLNVGSVKTSAGEVTVGNNPGDDRIVITVGTFPLNSQLIVSYNTTITDLVQANSWVDNVATATYDTAVLSTNNTGDVRPLEAPARSTFLTAAPELKFVFNSSSNPETPAKNVSIGERVSFTVNITLTPAFTLLSTLEVKFPSNVTTGRVKALYGQVLYMAPTVTTAAVAQGYLVNAVDTNNDTVPDAVIFDFGTFNNIPDEFERGPADNVTVEVVGMVYDDPANVYKNVLTTQAFFTYSNTFVNTTLADNQSVLIIEPFLSIAHNVTGYDYSFIEGGNIVHYMVAINHTKNSTSAAYNIQVVNLFSPLMELIQGSVNTTSGVVISGDTVVCLLFLFFSSLLANSSM